MPTESMLVVTVDDAETAELVSDRLWQLGVRGVVERAIAGGAVELSTSVGDAPAALDRAVATLDPGWSWRVERVDSAASDAWRDHVEPVWFTDDRVCVPAWLTDADVPGIDRATSVTRIEPGGSFGLGDHPTTRLSLAAIAELLDPAEHGDRSPIRSVLDVGCGSGALSVLAAQLGAPTCVGIDLADEAVVATRDNADRNGVAGRVSASTTPLADVDGTFDLVVANILAPVLVSLAADLRRVLAPEGVLVVSGVLADRHDHVVEALAPLRPVSTTTHHGWAAVTFER